MRTHFTWAEGSHHVLRSTSAPRSSTLPHALSGPVLSPLESTLRHFCAGGRHAGSSAQIRPQPCMRLYAARWRRPAAAARPRPAARSSLRPPFPARCGVCWADRMVFSCSEGAIGLLDASSDISYEVLAVTCAPAHAPTLRCCPHSHAPSTLRLSAGSDVAATPA
eukprot:357658-Chlamydomonas_euryale.AAC.2